MLSIQLPMRYSSLQHDSNEEKRSNLKDEFKRIKFVIPEGVEVNTIFQNIFKIAF